MGWVKEAQDNPTGPRNEAGLTPEAAAFWEAIAAAGGGDTAGGGLSLGGDGSGFSMPNSVYNQMTGEYIPVGGTDNLNPDFGKYKQHVYLGTEHGTVWLPEGVSSADFLANPDAYQTVDNADGFSRTVVGGGTAPPPSGTSGGGTTGGGTAGGGTSGGGTAGGTPPPWEDEPSGPTDDWFWTDPVGYENAPQPDGDGSFVEGGPPADTSWDWSFFRDKAPGDRQWGGYDEDYQAFERYQPGMESPWGMPNIEGGNEDFYQQQFVNQLRDEQGFRNRQRAAAMRAQEAANAPSNDITPQEMWSWAYGGQGLPDVKMGGGERTTNYNLVDGLTRDSTFDDILRRAASQDVFMNDDYARKQIQRMLKTPNDSTYWSRIGDPQKIIQNLGKNEEGLTGVNRALLSKIANSIYQQDQAAPYAPGGYASPIQWGNDYNSYASGGE